MFFVQPNIQRQKQWHRHRLFISHSHHTYTVRHANSWNRKTNSVAAIIHIYLCNNNNIILIISLAISFSSASLPYARSSFIRSVDMWQTPLSTATRHTFTYTHDIPSLGIDVVHVIITYLLSFRQKKSFFSFFLSSFLALLLPGSLLI